MIINQFDTGNYDFYTANAMLTNSNNTQYLEKILN